MVFDMIMSSYGLLFNIYYIIGWRRGGEEVEGNLIPVGFHLGVALSCPYATIPAALRCSALRRHFDPKVGVWNCCLCFLVSRLISIVSSNKRATASLSLDYRDFLSWVMMEEVSQTAEIWLEISPRCVEFSQKDMEYILLMTFQGRTSGQGQPNSS